MKLTQAKAYQVFDSRGMPTVAVCLWQDEKYAIGMAPSGASTGSHEAFELRDGDESLGSARDRAFQGKGVQKALKIFTEKIQDQLLQKDFADQQSLDSFLQEIDGSNNFQNFGSNIAIATSIAFLRLQALVQGKEVFEVLAEQFSTHNSQFTIPAITPMVNVINGGKHADSGFAIQEVMIVPVKGKSTTEKIAIAAEVFNSLKEVIREKGMSTLVGDEGGFAPAIKNVSQAFDLIEQACQKTNYSFGEDIKIALDVAATELYKNGMYLLEGTQLTTQQLVNFYKDLVTKYPIMSIEDPFAEDDFEGWKMLKEQLGDKVQIVGDDLTVTNVERMKMVKEKDLISAMIIKPNQIGTITQTMEAIRLANEYGWKTIISHRSGETEDTTIADLAYAVNSPFIKTGSMSRSERMCKYNRLITIEELNNY